jgi:phosphohistidine phosphatase SixA/8-oxo-dGTP pyrophosphatase MutT (NUDIX family)
MAREDVVRAAGVVLLREREGQQEVLIIHRPIREDWSIPKGKIDPGEHVLAAAVRECDEETGLVPILGCPLPTQSYRAMNQPKVVQYWRATVGRDEGFYADDETDEIAWVPVERAKDHLTYPSDIGLVKSAAVLPDTSPLILLRHSQAVKRANFEGADDSYRPLTGKGRTQSRQLVPVLSAFGVHVIRSSSAVRCRQTVEPLAAALHADIDSEPALTESLHESDPAATADRVAEIAHDRRATVICSHRPVLPTLVGALCGDLGMDLRDKRYAKALDARLSPSSFIVIHRVFDADGRARVAGIERHTLEGD